MKRWIFLIPVVGIVLFGSLAYGCSELTMYSWPASIGVCQRHWIIWQFLYDYQGLVGGLLALIAAGIGAWALVHTQNIELNSRDESFKKSLRSQQKTIVQNCISWISVIADNHLLHQEVSSNTILNNNIIAINNLASIDGRVHWAALSLSTIIEDTQSTAPSSQKFQNCGLRCVALCTILKQIYDKNSNDAFSDDAALFSKNDIGAFDPSPITGRLRHYPKYNSGDLHHIVKWKKQDLGELEAWFDWPKV